MSEQLYESPNYKYYLENLPKNKDLEIPTRATFESLRKVHSREEIKNYFENCKTEKLSDSDCKIIVTFLMKKYSLEEFKIGSPINYVYSTLKRGDVLYFDGGFFRISLSCFENYVVFGHNNKEMERPLMSEIFDLFE
jgi:hypothetical protein